MTDTTAGLPYLFAQEGEFLSGPESRALRCALGLERRHVLTLVNALGLTPRVATMDTVTSWEKSRERGYPGEVVDALHALDTAVQTLAARYFATPLDRGRAVLRRPLGAKRAHQLLAPADHGLDIPPGPLRILDHSGGEFWVALADTALTRAALRFRDRGIRTYVELDREPDETVSPDPPAQSARGGRNAS